MSAQWLARRFGDLDALELVDSDVPAPGAGEVTIEVRAAGMNPADWKYMRNGDAQDLPYRIGYEVAGVLTAVGPDTEIGSGGGALGDEVLAFRIRGGYSARVTVPAKDVFAKPAELGFPEAANLLLVGTTAAEMLDVTRVSPGETILVHGASGATGVSVLQQARLIGARVIGTASETNFDVVRRFGGEPVRYGDGLQERVQALAPDGVHAALDTVGTAEAIDVSVALVDDRSRIVSIAAFGRAEELGYRIIAGRMPASARFRDAARARLIEMAGRGELVVPLARTYPLAEAIDALELLRSEHPGGKLALIP
ncbi:NADP-dependent oxidoreductase [Herbiconiux sp. L3-i23]|uniref:NADP-dependent oxidoreductase n=1 Tax=Herbiconiux sp. L3-i23 TaxID=2905871 RepID=UPI00206F5749|nr:NADP-dependent oxidoreductase [Herbiconiux sp. L3-i23]BDI23340.1 putative oxidoreductase [Herbiconiux sp. L3-i23]